MSTHNMNRIDLSGHVTLFCLLLDLKQTMLKLLSAAVLYISEEFQKICLLLNQG